MGVPARDFPELHGFSPRHYRTAARDRDLRARWMADGWRILYDQSIVVLHAHELTLRSPIRQHRTFRTERAGFYIALLLHARSARVRFLLLLSQVAHTIGFVSGYLSFGPGVRA